MRSGTYNFLIPDSWCFLHGASSGSSGKGPCTGRSSRSSSGASCSGSSLKKVWKNSHKVCLTLKENTQDKLRKLYVRFWGLFGGDDLAIVTLVSVRPLLLGVIGAVAVGRPGSHSDFITMTRRIHRRAKGEKRMQKKLTQKSHKKSFSLNYKQCNSSIIKCGAT